MTKNKQKKMERRVRMERQGISHSEAVRREQGANQTAVSDGHEERAGVDVQEVGATSVPPTTASAPPTTTAAQPPSYVLTEHEAELATSIRVQLAAIKKAVGEHQTKGVPDAISVMGSDAHRLHMSLKANGHEPRHRRHMLKNRGVRPTSAEFYRHIHPTEDLMAFLRDPTGNDDPMDQTIDHEFKLKIYSRRWGHDDPYTLRRTTRGWSAEMIQNFDADKDGRVNGERGTGLFQHFRQDGINYPEALPEYLQQLWVEAEQQGFTHEQVQAGLDRLAKWVNDCERGTPAGLFETVG